MYLIIKCRPLGDQWECDADREPVYVGSHIPNKYKKYGFEHYKISSNGIPELIKDWEE